VNQLNLKLVILLHADSITLNFIVFLSILINTKHPIIPIKLAANNKLDANFIGLSNPKGKIIY
jgi:hypothetical protein